MSIFKFIGVFGLFLISLGVIIKERKRQKFFYIIGGGCLVIYSIYIKDLIFIILQIIFILAAVYDFFKVCRKKN